MKKQATYEDWKRLFQQETGHSADIARYTPVHPIDVPIYVDQTSSAHSPPENEVVEKGLRPDHKLITDQNTYEYVSKNIQMIQQYRITEILTVDFSEKENEALMSDWNSASDTGVNLSGLDSNTPFYLDFREARRDLSSLKKWRDETLKNDSTIWYSPEDDFLWNVGMIRGLHTYFSQHHPEYWIKKVPAAYINLNKTADKESENQLIPLTNILLSVASAGIKDFVWDIRKMTDWQKDHFHLLMNIPEILSRESRIYEYGDVVKGSGFFEALADEVKKYLAE